MEKTVDEGKRNPNPVTHLSMTFINSKGFRLWNPIKKGVIGQIVVGWMIKRPKNEKFSASIA